MPAQPVNRHYQDEPLVLTTIFFMAPTVAPRRMERLCEPSVCPGRALSIAGCGLYVGMTISVNHFIIWL